MDLSNGISFIVMFILIVHTFGQQHRPCTGECDTACYAEFSKYDANSFLSNGKRSTPRECCHESYCEQQGARCKTEQYRTYLVNTHSRYCPPNTVIGVTNWCYGHYAFDCLDPCKAIEVDRCENGGTCIPKGTAWTCSCRPGFEGNICSIDIDECAGVTCDPTRSKGCIDMENDYRCDCKPGWTGKLCDIDIDECASSPCLNGGTCKDHLNGYTCACMGGYTGIRCETDIDECASNPCKNNATCHNLINYYKCTCPPRFYGVNCDTNICHPTPADVVFILDSSVSMTKQQFQKQLEFVANFTREVKVGPRDFQISVIKYSTEANIEFYLNDFQDNVTLLDAIINIKYTPGSTFTDKALHLVFQVFSSHHGIERRINGTMANRFVYLLTDGLSTDRAATAYEAAKLKNSLGVTILAIGIGHDVSHQELLDIASDSSNVYSVNNFNSLNTVLKRLVYFTCDECLHSAASDVVMLLDASADMTVSQFDKSLEAARYIIDIIKLGPNDTRLGLTTFSDTINTVFDLDEFYEKTLMKISLNTLQTSPSSVRLTLSSVFQHARRNLFKTPRPSSKQFLLVFTNGNFSVDNMSEFERERDALEMENIKIFVIGSGEDINASGLFRLVEDSYNVFIINEDIPKTSLAAIQSEFVYDVCDIKQSSLEN